MLLRLVCLGTASTFAMLRLLPVSDRDMDVEVLALRHQIAVLERQLNGQRVRFDAGDRAFLAALLQGLPTEVLRGMRPAPGGYATRSVSTCSEGPQPRWAAPSWRTAATGSSRADDEQPSRECGQRQPVRSSACDRNVAGQGRYRRPASPARYC
ncbi:hypothetical protein [Streptomyces tendae]|uniref:hypothetical protein n=1 Tax=Streptomyces tendae TaxID=1932 RepID=UPI002493B1E0|nr:hypothetical protein [Streptomyces tendae]